MILINQNEIRHQKNKDSKWKKIKKEDRKTIWCYENQNI